MGRHQVIDRVELAEVTVRGQNRRLRHRMALRPATKSIMESMFGGTRRRSGKFRDSGTSRLLPVAEDLMADDVVVGDVSSGG
jgi:hypothetical protein